MRRFRLFADASLVAIVGLFAVLLIDGFWPNVAETMLSFAVFFFCLPPAALLVELGRWRTRRVRKALQEPKAPPVVPGYDPDAYQYH
jgi:hypothetical protein